MKPFVLSLFFVFVSSLFLNGQENEEQARLTFHRKPAPLPKGAVTSDWPRFLGPTDNASIKESPLREDLGNGLPLVWELRKGTGYTCPAIVGDRLVFFHRLGDEEKIECRNPESGRLLWEQSYGVDYQDRYGYNNGPRSSPVIGDGLVFTLGVRSMLTCCELATGKKLWQRDLGKEYEVPAHFFGNGSSPLLLDGRLILNVGGTRKKECVVAFDPRTGEEQWVARNSWGTSYASPLAGTVHGKSRVLVFAGGESRPSTGGLLHLDPSTGKVASTFPWRARKYESVNAASPVLVDNRVFISETYGAGGIALDIGEDGSMKEAWRAKRFGVHWMTPVHADGYLYGVDGRHDLQAQVVCYDWKTGRERWRKDLSWTDQVDGAERNGGFLRGSLLRIGNRFLGLGELGDLLWLDLSPEGCQILSRVKLFEARETWTLPALSKGLLYVSQHYRTREKQPRLLCYDLRPSS
ncbi:MAG: PQQ-binding-like beta-propeller repeat protein [Verrucomicrobiota bacterium]